MAVFILIYWLTEFSLSAVGNRFELRCQSKANDAIVLQNLLLLAIASKISTVAKL